MTNFSDMINLIKPLIIILVYSNVNPVICYCNYERNVQCICENMRYDTRKFMTFPVDKSIHLELRNLSGRTKLTKPNKELQLYSKYNSVKIIKSCIEHIDDDYFASLGNVYKIELKDIRCLKVLRKSIFNGLENKLTILYLSINDLTSIESFALDQLTNLKNLTIQHTKLKKLPNMLLDHLTKLNHLNVGYNRLFELPIYPVSKDYLVITGEGNQFLCDCRMEIYRQFMRNKNFFNIMCHSPAHLRGYRLRHAPSMCETVTVNNPLVQINISARETIPSELSTTQPITTSSKITTTLISVNSSALSPVKRASKTLADYLYLIIVGIILFIVLIIIIVIIIECKKHHSSKQMESESNVNKSGINKEDIVYVKTETEDQVPAEDQTTL